MSDLVASDWSFTVCGSLSAGNRLSGWVMVQATTTKTASTATLLPTATVFRIAILLRGRALIVLMAFSLVSERVLATGPLDRNPVFRGEFPDDSLTTEATKSRVFLSPKGHVRHIHDRHVVDMRHACLDLVSEPKSAGFITGKHSA